ncbi:sulfotransferase domain-containing protein [Shimia marina]|uniref:Sulfotransferase domain protein n=1 Tax=Shimia marina TaxID=321267 RepID=A0A0P1EMA9_9RHOB|nr:sulfotransferase domain-containing protein [Shimia marina]CUH51525.1 Sulfotransferase domain protein [Shimia marina]SFD46981.1 Sulfotransferase domain-containing protein [Shimia marina]
MLILNNGVPKSGSTWMQNILRNYLSPAYPSEKWANDWKNPSVDPDKLEGYVASGEWKEGTTLLKTHIEYSEGYKFLVADDIKVVVTYRKLTDSVVSWFHHQLRMNKTSSEDKLNWLDTKGRQFALRAVRHRLSWQDQPNALMVNYESMVQDAVPLIEEVTKFIGSPCSLFDAINLVEKTQVRISSKKSLQEGQHVRTGGLSVAKEELPEAYLKELEALQEVVEAGSFTPEIAKAFREGKLEQAV